jgi:antigen flippase
LVRVLHTYVSKEQSYAQILRASSIMGGAAGINLLLGMLRVKFAAVLIGATGVGLNASFAALQGVLGTLAGLGIASSAVRDVAAAVARGDAPAIGRTVRAVRRVAWMTGLGGMGTMFLLSPLLSQLTFGHRGYTFDIAALGIAILFGNIAGGEMALIQGVRRIGDMARANIYGAVAGTLAAVCFYATLGLRGIVPSLIAIAAINLVLSMYFARRIPVSRPTMTWRETLAETHGFVQLGFVMMWSGLLVSAVTYLTIILITQHEGTQAVGLYSAAFALSGVFVSFVLTAMGADYFPRLVGLAGDPSAMNRLVNEQTEIGLLLAVPGLLVTLVLAPWIIQIFYTREFIPAVELLRWFVLGCLGRVISWPLGFVMLALGKSRWFFLTETMFNMLHLGLIAAALSIFGLKGVAMVFPVLYIGYTVTVLGVAFGLTKFCWTRSVVKKVFGATSVLGVCMLLVEHLSPLLGMTLGIVAIGVSCLICLRALVQLVGADHRFSRALFRIPGAQLIRPKA